MVNRHSQTGFAHIVLLVTVAVVLAVAATLFTRNALAVRREASLYAQADAQVQKYIGDINKKFPGKVTSSRGCSYTHEKYSKGQLGCGVDGAIEIPIKAVQQRELILNFADKTQRHLGWSFRYDNTSGNQRIISNNYLKSVVYSNGVLRCGIQYLMKEDENRQIVFVRGLQVLIIQADCSGKARAEHYPIGG